MARIPRSRSGRGVFHVLNRAYDRRFIFETDADKSKFVSLLAEHLGRYQLNVYHWVIMGNHFHLAVEAVRVEELSRAIGKVCELYSRYWRKAHGGVGTLWQGRFKSVIVQKDGYLNRLGRYVERNPMVVKLCDWPWDYSWSSSAAYASGAADPLVLVEDHPFYHTMGETDDERQRVYRTFVMSERELWEQDVELFASAAPAIGDDEFVRQKVAKSGRLTSRRVGRPRKAEA